MSPPNLISQGAADPNRTQSQNEMCRNVCQSQRALAVSPKVHGLVAKGRESREAAEDADKHKGARFGGKDTSRFSQLGKKTDDEAADEIYGERAVGKVYAAAQLLDISRARLEKSRANETTDTC